MKFFVHCLAAALMVVGWNSAVSAQRNFEVRYSALEEGNIVLIGNTIMSCTSAEDDCSAAQQGAPFRNESFDNQYVDVDSNPATFNSSTAVLNLPPGAQVLHASLYWTGIRTDQGQPEYFQPAPNDNMRGNVIWTAPGGTPTDVNGAVDLLSHDGGDPVFFQGSADVTGRMNGAGAYTIGNIQASTGRGRYGGWVLAVAYADPAAPVRSLTIWDGFVMRRNTDPSLTIPLNGFAPVSNGSPAMFAFAKYDGDRSNRDSIFFDDDILTNAANPLDDSGNSSISFLGNTIQSSTPNYVNNLGIDIDHFDVTNSLTNTQANTMVRLSADLDWTIMGVAALALDTDNATLVGTKTVKDENDGLVEPGDELLYTLTFRNAGATNAVNVNVVDMIPEGTTYVTGSLEGAKLVQPIVWIPQSDAVDGDRAEFDNNTVTARIGTSSALIMRPGEQWAIRFLVTVDCDVPAATAIGNQGSFTFTDNLGQNQSGLTDGDPGSVGDNPAWTVTCPTCPPGCAMGIAGEPESSTIPILTDETLNNTDLLVQVDPSLFEQATSARTIHPNITVGTPLDPSYGCSVAVGDNNGNGLYLAALFGLLFVRRRR